MNDIDFNKFFDMIMSFIDAPTWKIALMLVGILAMCILLITRYFHNRNKREELAWEEAQKVKKQQIEITLRVQKDSANALIQNLNTSYKLDFDFFVEAITNKSYEKIYTRLHETLHEKVGSFLYNEELTPNVRAASLIRLMKGREI